MSIDEVFAEPEAPVNKIGLLFMYKYCVISYDLVESIVGISIYENYMAPLGDHLSGVIIFHSQPCSFISK